MPEGDRETERETFVWNLKPWKTRGGSGYQSGYEGSERLGLSSLCVPSWTDICPDLRQWSLRPIRVTGREHQLFLQINQQKSNYRHDDHQQIKRFSIFSHIAKATGMPCQIQALYVVPPLGGLDAQVPKNRLKPGLLTTTKSARRQNKNCWGDIFPDQTLLWSFGSVLSSL